MKDIIKLLSETKAKTEQMFDKIEVLTQRIEGMKSFISNITYALINLQAVIQLLTRDGLLDPQELKHKVEELAQNAQSAKTQ